MRGRSSLRRVFGLQPKIWKRCHCDMDAFRTGNSENVVHFRLIDLNWNGTRVAKCMGVVARWKALDQEDSFVLQKISLPLSLSLSLSLSVSLSFKLFTRYRQDTRSLGRSTSARSSPTNRYLQRRQTVARRIICSIAVLLFSFWSYWWKPGDRCPLGMNPTMRHDTTHRLKNLKKKQYWGLPWQNRSNMLLPILVQYWQQYETANCQQSMNPFFL